MFSVFFRSFLAFKAPENLAALFISLGTVLALVLLPKGTVRGWEIHWPFWIFLVQTLAFLGLFGYLARDFFNDIKEKLPQKHWILFLLVFTVAMTWYTGSQIEAVHRVQSDESIFLAAAQNMYHNQLSGACDAGWFEDGKLHCDKTANNFKTKFQSWLYTIGMPFFGTDLHWIFTAQLMLYALTLLAVWLAVLLWTSSVPLAFLTAVTLMVQPTVMFQFRAMSVEPLYVFLSALSLIFFWWAQKKNSVLSWVLCALVLGAFAQTRQETVFALFAFGFFAMPNLSRGEKWKLPAFLVTLTTFSLPVLLTIAAYRGYGFQGGEFEAHGHFLTHLKINFGVMTTPVGSNGLLSNPFLSWFTWTSLLGLFVFIYLAWKDEKWRKWLLFWAVYHLQSYMIFENVSGDFTITINQRYALVILPVMAFLTAIFLKKLVWDGLVFLSSSKDKLSSPKVVFAITLAFCLFAAALTMRHQESLNANVMYRRNHLTMEEQSIHKWLKENTGRKMFVYARPWHFIGYGQSAYHYNPIMNMPTHKLDSLIEAFEGDVYYVRGMDCWNSQTYHKKAVENRIASTCDRFEDKVETKTVYQDVITNNYQLTIRKIMGKKDYNESKALRLGQFYFIPSKEQPPGEIQYSYALEKTSPQLHQIRLRLNGKIIREFAFENKRAMDTLKEAPIEPGYNTLTFTVRNPKGKSLFRKSVTRFFPVDSSAVKLVDLQPTTFSQGWGQLQKNRSVNANPLRIADYEYEEGLGTHAPSSITYNLQGQYQRFQAWAGLDDEELGGNGVRFKLEGDGRELWASGVVKHMHRVRVDVDVSGVQNLTLVVDDLGDKNFDHADWALPQLKK